MPKKELHGYASGQLKSSSIHHAGTTAYKNYAPTGQILIHYQYRDGKKHGRQYRYSLEGELVFEGAYEAGKLME